MTRTAWAVPLIASQFAWDELWSTLSSDERNRAQEFRIEDLKRRFVIARCALRKLLGRYLGVQPTTIEFAIDSNGKPRLADKHTGYRAATSTFAFRRIGTYRGCGQLRSRNRRGTAARRGPLGTNRDAIFPSVGSRRRAKCCRRSSQRRIPSQLDRKRSRAQSLWHRNQRLARRFQNTAIRVFSGLDRITIAARTRRILAMLVGVHYSMRRLRRRNCLCRKRTPSSLLDVFDLGKILRC